MTIFRTTLLLLFIPLNVWALTPIAQTDVVPRQRIESGETFNFGVIAFSKAGIDYVSFAISGQGYSGGTKTVSSMALNTRVASASPGAEYSGVYEYYVTISASEFTSNGAITVTPTVYGDDAGSKALSAVTLYVEGGSDESRTEAWVDDAASDGAGTLNDENDPYDTIADAISAIQAENGDCDYAIIYLAEDIYNTGITGTTTTTNEWLTITRESGASIENVILDEEGTSFDTDYLKFEGVTLRSTSGSDYVIPDNNSAYTYWIDHCSLVGAGRATASSEVYHPDNIIYTTGNYIYDSRYGGYGSLIARGNKISTISNDAFVNQSLVVNNHVDDVDPDGTEGCNGDEVCHADTYQAHSQQIDNRIIYNLYGTDLNYQGLFMRMTAASGNMAVVNMFVELRSLHPDGGGFNGLYGEWDHLLLWHNTFAATGEPSYWGWGTLLFDEESALGSSGDWDNTSVIGNMFHRLTWSIAAKSESTVFGGSNTQGNDARYNHYEVADDYIGTDYTTGDDAVDISTPGAADFGYPVTGSDLIDGLPSNLTGVPCDALGNARDANPDIGALEIVALSPNNTLQKATRDPNAPAVRYDSGGVGVAAE